jgi:translocation and assembly module TamB
MKKRRYQTALKPSHGRQHLVDEAERASGGRAEIGRFRFDWKTLTAEVRQFVLHGTEPAGEQPLVRADSIRVGLRIISLMERNIDIASLTLVRPQVNIIVDAQGRTNFPSPKLSRPITTDPIQMIVQLAIKQVAVQQGIVHVGDRELPLDIRGENLDLALSYDVTGPRYQGKIAMQKMHVDSGRMLDLAFDMNSEILLERKTVRFERGHLAMPKSSVDFSGVVTDVLNPQLAMDVKATGDLAELSKPLSLAQPNRGVVTFIGKVTYSAAEKFLLAGNLSGNGLAVSQDGMHVSDIRISSSIRFDLHDIALRDLKVSALGGAFSGRADLKALSNYKVSGRVAGLSLEALTRAANVKGVVWSGQLAGPVEVGGTLSPRASDFKGSAQLDLTRGTGGVPVSGQLDVAYDQRSQRIELGKSHVETAASKLNFDGTLGEHLDVRLESKDLNDLLPGLAMASTSAPEKLPLSLTAGGSALFEGTVDGKPSAAALKGHILLTQFTSGGQSFDRLTANVAANENGIRLQAVTLAKDQMVLEGSADAGLQNWKLVDASPVSANLKLRGAQIAALLAIAGQKAPVDGLLSGAISLDGTLGNPRASMQALVEKPVAYGEKFDRFRTQIRYADNSLEIVNGELSQGAAEISVAGAYHHKSGEWKDGSVRFDVTTKGFTLEQVRNIQEYRPGIKGRFALHVAGDATIAKLTPLLNHLNGQLTVQSLVVDEKQIGSVAVDASTVGTTLTIGASGELRGSKIAGNGIFQLTGDYPAKGELVFSPMTIATIQDLATPKGKDRLPVDGVVEGRITFAGPARTPDLMTARVEVPKLELISAQNAAQPSGLAIGGKNGSAKLAQDLVLRNAGPIVMTVDGKGIHIQSAHMVGRDSNVEATGTINLRDDKNPWDLRITGSVNMAILQDFQPGLLASGKSIVNATFRGTLSQPQLNGRLELNNASFYLENMPNGIDQANGVLLFDRNRATIANQLTARTGGGQIALTGFVGFGTGEIIYRLQGRADNVRYRGEGVSVTGNANVTLTGTSTHSLLAGTLTIVKAGFNPKADLGSLLLASSIPISTPTTPNQFLRGLQLDVHIGTIPNLQFQTSLSADLQADADLHVHGSAVRPVLSGRVDVNQGEVRFFGNKYTINRGDIAFYNTTKIEPVLDMDLETQVRGVTVNINFSGPINKLNLSYRSDPPLQPSEIIALLAVGRAPGTNSALSGSQTLTQQSVLATSTNTLLGQAISAPVSSRLQRFFGVSRLKIDPLLTGVNATPQARLTLEQQISKDITLTYVTNLAQANQQLVKVEWDINTNWSAVAIREENGVFGIDFLYKKRFK